MRTALCVIGFSNCTSLQAEFHVFVNSSIRRLRGWTRRPSSSRCSRFRRRGEFRGNFVTFFCFVWHIIGRFGSKTRRGSFNVVGHCVGGSTTPPPTVHHANPTAPTLTAHHVDSNGHRADPYVYPSRRRATAGHANAERGPCVEAPP